MLLQSLSFNKGRRKAFIWQIEGISKGRIWWINITSFWVTLQLFRVAWFGEMPNEKLFVLLLLYCLGGFLCFYVFRGCFCMFWGFFVFVFVLCCCFLFVCLFVFFLGGAVFVLSDNSMQSHKRASNVILNLKSIAINKSHYRIQQKHLMLTISFRITSLALGR